MQDKYSKTYFNFIPETFVLPDQLAQFEESFLQVQARHNHKGKVGSNLWIVKPSSSSRGRGIFIVDKLKQVPRHENCIISKYIDNPLLLYEHKFDLRIYVLVTCYDPLRVYLFREGLVRFASEKYDASNITEAGKFAHLTNYSINKKNENYI